MMILAFCLMGADQAFISEDPISPLLLKGFPTYLSAARDQIDKYSGCEGYTQKDTPTNSAAIKTAEHNHPFMNDHTNLQTHPAWAVIPMKPSTLPWIGLQPFPNRTENERSNVFPEDHMQ
jgi:hypothetical protein